jgi:hypothetical protein
MEELPIRLRIYLITVYILAFGLLVYLLLTSGDLPWAETILFFMWAWVAGSLEVKLPKSAVATLSMAIIFAGNIIFGPAVAVLIALGDAVTWGDIKEKARPYKVMFNASNLILTAGLAGLTYVALNGPVGNLTLNDFPYVLLPIILAATVYFLVNTWLVALAIGLSEGLSPLNIWSFDFKWAMPNAFMLAIIGVVLAQVYFKTGPSAVILVTLPLVVARQTFQVYMRLRESYRGTVKALVAALEAKDPYTRGHSERVADYAVKIGRELKLSEEKLEVLQFAGLLHDIGKVGIRKRILNKTEKLSEDEYRSVQGHPEIATKILANVDFLRETLPAIFYHHERVDGRGYVEGLAGEDIPLIARVLTVADSFDAMTKARPYRGALTLEEAVQELIRCSGTQFDKEIVQALLKTLDLEEEKPEPISRMEGQLSLAEDTS